MTLIKSNKSLVTGNKGQVALFVALIFQVLFLFFAMIVNVGLVVHHKINLQNSVDMAAYYGAMKQAELLNSIGHINYQMRQSWKLLAWRYRVLGTAGDVNYHPYDHLHQTFRNGMDVEYSESNPTRGNFSAPPFCITYNPFNESIVPPGENTCKKTMSPSIQADIIRLFRPPSVAAGFISFAVATTALTQSLKNSALNRCGIVGPYNYIIVGSFMLAYQLDQYVRRVSLTKIARSMSRDKVDFDDIEGKSVKAGAEETFKRNLTYANKEGRDLTFEMYNSLAGCGNVPSDEEQPPPWLAEMRVFPTIYYMDLLNCEDNSANSLNFKPKNFDLVNPGNVDSYDNIASMPASYHNGKLGSQQLVRDRIRYIAQSLSLYNERYRFILGYEKNPWCQAYVGIKASTKPKIPFAPSELTLSASAYAKPFGGKIGPWYYKRWDSGTPESSGSIDDRVDNQLSLRIKDFATLGSDPSIFGNPLRIANYSKYIGDNYGLTSWRYLAHQAKAFFNLSAKQPYRTFSTPSTVTDQKVIANEANEAPRLEDWDLIAQPIESNRTKDILAWNNLEGKESGMRMLELQALAPDQFDLAYYSIDPNFYENYYKKLQTGLLRKLGLNDAFFRPDIGARIGDPKLEKFSVKDQIKTVKDFSQGLLDFNTKLTYAVLNPVHLLTSWSNKSVFNYDKPDSDFFGNCLAPETSKTNYVDPQTNTSFLGPNESVPGECISGGRTGYSVKIISKDYLFSPIKAGGTSGSEAVIINPPTDF
ncbi:MAG: Tad domain-containing protein [Bdellovibrionaceae bacterium]|nr:Tad domain-containing protein [Pseudobdellovibrionaceae bacterium]